MTTREIGPKARPLWDFSTGGRARVSPISPHSLPNVGSQTSGEDSCVVRFFNRGKVVYQETSHLSLSSAARLAYTAVKEALENWRSKSTQELKLAGFGLDPECWDSAEVNGKPFPRI